MSARTSAFWEENHSRLIELVAKHRLPNGNIHWHSVSREMGISRAACVSRWKNRGHLPPVATPQPSPPPDPVVVERQRQERVRDLRQELDLVRALAGEKSLRAMLEKLVSETALNYSPPPFRPPPKSLRDVVIETLYLLFSDWHYAEIVEDERVRGFNRYDTEVAKRRVHKVVSTVASIAAKMQRGGGWSFPRMVVGANGDFVSGTIHELERHSDARSIVDAVYECGMLLASALRDLLSVVPEITVYCTSGNHGRLPDAKRVQQKDPLRSWDTMVYLFAREHLRNVKGLTWVIPNSYAVSYVIEGWNFLQQHGHDIKSWNSIPYYGMNRAVSNLNALEASRGGTMHYFCFGHFHGDASLPHASGKVLVNGSLIGGTEFSVNALGKSDPPSQLLMGVHQDHGATHRWDVKAGPGESGEGYELPRVA